MSFFSTRLIIIVTIYIYIANATPVFQYSWNIELPNRAAQKVIVDIDPGIDDIEALTMLLNAHNRRRVEIIAIVVSEGNTVQKYGIENTFRLLQAANHLDIPVFAGSFLQILPHENLENFFGKDGFGDLNWLTRPPTFLMQDMIATTAIKRLTDRYPNEISYITLGPMTNLALAMRMYDGLAARLKNVYSMGGLYNTDRGEFNILFDPESAEIVLAMLQTPMTLFTWQACEKNAPQRIWFENATITNPVFEMVLRAERSLKAMHPTSPTWISCDPMTIATMLEETSILDSFTSPLYVELDPDNGRGIMRVFNETETGQSRQAVRVIMELDYTIAQEVFLRSFDEVCKTHRCS